MAERHDWDRRQATLTVAASDSLYTRNADYICDGTNDEVEIQAAIDALPAGGGTVKLLEGIYNLHGAHPTQTDYIIFASKSNVSLIGCGWGTVLRVPDNYAGGATRVVGTSGYHNIRIAHLKVDGNYVAADVADMKGIYIANTDNSVVEDCWVYQTRTWGIVVYTGSYGVKIKNNVIEECVDASIMTAGSDATLIEGNVILQGAGAGRAGVEGIVLAGGEHCIIANNYMESNAIGCIVFHNDCNYYLIIGNSLKPYNCPGILFRGALHAGVTMNHNIIIGNYIDGGAGGVFAGSRGIEMTLGIAEAMSFNLISANKIWNCQMEGIYLNGVLHNQIEGNFVSHNSIAADNTYDNIYLEDADYNSIQNNICRQGVAANKPRYGINISNAGCSKNIVKDNDLYDAGSTANLNDAGTCTHIHENRDTEITDEKVYERVKNTSGGALAAGDVVILKSVAAGNEITTTTRKGDGKVYGMVAETIDNNASGLVQIGGKTTQLKVNGVEDIAIGDYISAFTVATIGCKAAAEDMSFAIALSGYTNDDSSGVIAAYLKSPWN